MSQFRAIIIYHLSVCGKELELLAIKLSMKSWHSSRPNKPGACWVSQCETSAASAKSCAPSNWICEIHLVHTLCYSKPENSHPSLRFHSSSLFKMPLNWNDLFYREGWVLMDPNHSRTTYDGKVGLRSHAWHKYVQRGSEEIREPFWQWLESTGGIFKRDIFLPIIESKTCVLAKHGGGSLLLDYLRRRRQTTST